MLILLYTICINLPVFRLEEVRGCASHKSVTHERLSDCSRQLGPESRVPSRTIQARYAHIYASLCLAVNKLSADNKQIAHKGHSDGASWNYYCGTAQLYIS